MLTPEQRGQRDAEPVELIPPVNRRQHEEVKHEHRGNKPDVITVDSESFPPSARLSEQQTLPYEQRGQRGEAYVRTDAPPINRTEPTAEETTPTRPDYVRSWD